MSESKVNSLQFASAHAPDTSSPLPDMSHRLGVVCVVVAMLVAGGLTSLRIADSRRCVTPDAAAYYLPLARQYAQGRISLSQSPIIPPMYPMVTALAAGAMRLDADDPIQLELAAQIVSAVCFVTIIPCVFLIGMKFGLRRVALAAAVLTAVNPWLIRFGASAGPDMLYGLVLAVSAMLLTAYVRGPAWPLAAASAATAALSALVRSEGVVMPVLVLGVVIAVQALGRRAPAERKNECRQDGCRGTVTFSRRLRKGDCTPAALRVGRTCVHVAIVLAVTAAVWTPRVQYVRQVTNHAVLDVRMLAMWPGGQRELNENIRWFAPPRQVNLDPVGDAEGRPLGARLNELQETLLGVIGYPTWILAGVWLLGRRRLAANGRLQLVLLAFIAFEVAAVWPVKTDRRYVAAVAPLAQIWAGLGLAVLAEWACAAKGLVGRVARRTGVQLAGLGLLAAGCVALGLAMPDSAMRHSHLKALGLEIRKELGPAQARRQIIVAATQETPYYADAFTMRVGQNKGATMSPDELWQACQGYRAVFSDHRDAIIVVEGDDKWCPWLVDALQRGKVPSDSILAVTHAGDKTAWAVYADACLPAMEAATVLAMPTHPQWQPTTTPTSNPWP